ncbi:hypothetical protein LTR84_004301 [Exophiala bonariae]|uniref:ubiquitinyl hydrolase 1 n=1 Tax=Exophiala bonariae TaxID=1690606 RepID=A0AAV9N8P8_9EURO|nr:hypothetical protein LTR84_004301 [Exophiala bonariae]
MPSLKQDCSIDSASTAKDDSSVAGTDLQQGSHNSSHSWAGWAELENDPLIFGTLLLEWGVSNIQVNEVVPLESVFDHPSNQTYGLVFLSPWAAPLSDNSIKKAPKGVWFANQTSSFSCATVALMNIINNQDTLDLGEKLNAFRAKTADMSPVDRGFALDHFDHARDVHNSFSTKFDQMVVDVRLKQDAVAHEKQKKKAAATANSKRPRKKAKIEEEYEDDEDDAGFHFVAYVPVGGSVWRMDGMEPLPRKVGEVSDGVDWIMMVLPELQATWESASNTSMEFSLLSLTVRTESSTMKADEEKMARVREDWGPFIAHMVKLHAEKGDLKQKTA